MSPQLQLSPLATYDKPFHYAVFRRLLPQETSGSILEWLENCASWRLVETGFYEQFEFDVRETQLPSGVAFLRVPEFLAQIRVQMENIFHARLGHRPEITAHKLVAGQRIRLHNDFVAGAETHRLVIQFGRIWREDNGGLLVMFNSADPADIFKMYPPTHNCAFGFAISPTSYHAVSTIHSGARFSLVYSFYAQRRIA